MPFEIARRAVTADPRGESEHDSNIAAVVGLASERALAESRARLDYAVRLSRIGFWYCDLPFDDLIWDDQVKEHFFLPALAHVTINTFYERIHPEDREPTRQAIDASIASREPYDVVYRTVDARSGQIKFIRALGGTAYGTDGAPRRFDGITVDVTAQKLDQEKLARAFEREREQARLLRQVADAALDIHASDSLDAVLNKVTAHATSLAGAGYGVTMLAPSAPEALTAPASWSSGESAAAPELEQAALQTICSIACVERRVARLGQSELEAHPVWRGLSGEGQRPAPRGVLAAPLIGRDGGHLGLIRLCNKRHGDFSETDEAILLQLGQTAAVAIENARLLEQRREQDQRKDEFLATLSHELRNPLGPIRAGLYLLRVATDPAQLAKTREMMERQLGHLMHIVDDLLDVSRIALAKEVLKKAPVDFRTVLHSTTEAVRPAIDAAGHELTIILPEEALPLHVDPTRIAQVFTNLLNNAAKYTPPGGLISVVAMAQAGELVVRVSDNGVGIPASMVGRVFDMFTQVQTSRSQSRGGLGIGLTLVKRLVEMHEGSVNAESVLGAGSTFTVRLPLARQP